MIYPSPPLSLRAHASVCTPAEGLRDTCKPLKHCHHRSAPSLFTLPPTPSLHSSVIAGSRGRHDTRAFYIASQRRLPSIADSGLSTPAHSTCSDGIAILRTHIYDIQTIDHLLLRRDSTPAARSAHTTRRKARAPRPAACQVCHHRNPGREPAPEGLQVRNTGKRKQNSKQITDCDKSRHSHCYCCNPFCHSWRGRRACTTHKTRLAQHCGEPDCQQLRITLQSHISIRRHG